VQCALHENHAKCPLARDRSSTWDVYIFRGAATRSARTNCSGELNQNYCGRFTDPQRNCVGAAASQRTAQGSEAGASEIVLGTDRGSLHGRGTGHAAIRSHVAELRRERSYRAAVFAAARSGVLRFSCVVCHGRKLSGMENGAVGALAQNLVVAAGYVHGGKPGGIWLHAGASAAALMWRISAPRCRDELTRDIHTKRPEDRGSASAGVQVAERIFGLGWIVNVRGSDGT
jgi:hypothetical protein